MPIEKDEGETRMDHADTCGPAAVEKVNRAFGQWQPISTAPKDGTVVLLGDTKFPDEVVAGYWGLASAAWGDGADTEFPWVMLESGNGINHLMSGHHGPTHWMPLPPAPQSDDRTDIPTSA